ncbi:MAG: sigma-70 family RNA polymerase sigma factor [Vulcanimicrobiaceae bacterium]
MIDKAEFLKLWLSERTDECRARVVADHRYLCVRAARRFLRSPMDRADLEQVAAIGLIKAVDRYDVACGTPFEAYAWILIVGELMHYVRDSESAVRAPRKLRELDKRWTRARRELTNEAGRDPSDAEVSARLHLDEKTSRDLAAYRNSQRPVSLDSVKNAPLRLAYCLEDQLDSLAREDLFSPLSPLERRIVSEIYERGTPLSAVAVRVGYSRRHTTRLHRNALAKIRRVYAASERA